MMNAEMAEEKEWMDMESRIRRHIGNDSFRILLTSKANGERFSKCSGILLEGVEGGVLYLLPEPEAERIMKEKDERFCLGVGKEHRSVMEIPEAYQEALLAREMAFIQKYPVEEYQKNNNGALLIITHRTRILEALHVDATHILADGKMVASGDSSLVDEIYTNGLEKYIQQ